MSIVSKAVDEIIRDLTDRRGLKHAWDGIDEDIQAEVRKRWEDILHEKLCADGIAPSIMTFGSSNAGTTSLVLAHVTCVQLNGKELGIRTVSEVLSLTYDTEEQAKEVREDILTAVGQWWLSRGAR